MADASDASDASGALRSTAAPAPGAAPNPPDRPDVPKAPKSPNPLDALCAAARGGAQNSQPDDQSGDLSPETAQQAQARAIQALFGPMTPWYDRQNRLFSLGLDQGWRKQLVQGVCPGPSGCLLDLAAGTLDVSLMLAQRFPAAHIIALDLCAPMLTYGMTRKVPQAIAGGPTLRIHPAQADARALPLSDASVDAVTIAFGLRNMEPRTQVLREIRRVLVPGGQLHVLELAPLRTPLIGTLYRWHLAHVIPYAAGLLSHRADAFRYLCDSIVRFPSPPELARELAAAGLCPVAWDALCLGVVNIHRATKPDN